MKIVKLIASDLDGTLFGPDSVPEPRTVEAVNAVVEAGYVFVAVSGRSYFGGAKRVVSTGAVAHWFIGSNGGHRFNLQTEQLEERLIFDAAHIEAIRADLPSNVDGVGFGFEHATGFSYDDGFRRAFPHAFDGGPRTNSADYSPHDIGKIFVSHTSIPETELIGATRPHVPDGTHVTVSGTSFVELTPQGADKAMGLERLCRQLGIDASEVIAFGDNNNDLSMLAWAGRGIAMANATPEVLASAREVTASNTDFGVAQVLESLL